MERLMERVRVAMEKYGVPGTDLYEQPSSPLRFPDGAHYRLEISAVESLAGLEALVDEMQKRSVAVHRVLLAGKGFTLIPRNDLKEIARIAHDAKLEIIAAPGPRSSWDPGSKQALTPEGGVGGRLRGSDNVALQIADILRGIDIGLRGFLLWDEGVLSILNQMRQDGQIPSNVIFKISVYAGYGSAAGIKILESLGANSVNPLSDLTRPMLAAIRHTVKIPLDVMVSVFESMGSTNRYWETAELARVCAPCYFKIEPGGWESQTYRAFVPDDTHVFLAREKVKHGEIIQELVGLVNPELVVSKPGAADLAIPQP